MRPICPGCARPVSVCLCDVIPSPRWNLQTRLLVLQHPHELKHKLATVPVLSRCIQPCHVVVGRRLHSSNWPFAASDDAGHTLLLFPGPDATELKLWYEEVTDRERVGAVERAEDALPRSMQALKVVRNDSDQNEDNGGGGVIKPKDIQITLVVVDGTWEHAQEMVKASLPFLSKFVTQVCLPFDVRSEGFGVGESDLIIRKEPYGGCVSTMEAVARSLAILEPDGHMVESNLMDVLRKMVSLQALHFSSPKIRPKLKKRSKEGLDMQVDKNG
ncbi:hypothetical protein KC19_6G113000 [Ceratodon purpureus]|uniref:tRNA-uridine aminocarboxypropyltransferase n=1 Tax=Ceratodon purpureus TaxID=3225 RepID=A0A8T0HIS1_CERPU|nr:hypothetical protein KC19_6G113000 [Ceratodon purpureus]